MSAKIIETAVASARGTAIKVVEGLDASEQTLKASSGSVYYLKGDNTANTSDDVWIKFYDAASPVVGTDAPYLSFKVRKGETVEISDPEGFAFATAISCACVTEADTGGTSSPTNPVNLTAYIN